MESSLWKYCFVFFRGLAKIRKIVTGYIIEINRIIIIRLYFNLHSTDIVLDDPFISVSKETVIDEF